MKNPINFKIIINTVIYNFKGVIINQGIELKRTDIHPPLKNGEIYEITDQNDNKYNLRFLSNNCTDKLLIFCNC